MCCRRRRAADPRCEAETAKSTGKRERKKEKGIADKSERNKKTSDGQTIRKAERQAVRQSESQKGSEVDKAASDW